MLKYIGNDNWYYISNNQMYYITQCDFNYYVYAITECMKQLFETKTITEAVRKINKEDI